MPHLEIPKETADIAAVIVFILFFVPGFISLKVYDLLVAGAPRDFSKDLYQAIAYSSLNYAFFIWLLVPINTPPFSADHRALYIFYMLVVVFIAPIVWPFLFLFVSKLSWASGIIIDPVAKPWDKMFQEQFKTGWVLVHLKDGSRIGGVYAGKSWASAFPNDEQIYLEELWDISPSGNFQAKRRRSQGGIVNGSEMQYIEFFSP